MKLDDDCSFPKKNVDLLQAAKALLESRKMWREDSEICRLAFAMLLHGDVIRIQSKIYGEIKAQGEKHREFLFWMIWAGRCGLFYYTAPGTVTILVPACFLGILSRGRRYFRKWAGENIFFS